MAQEAAKDYRKHISVRDVAFVVRCSGAATLSFVAASVVGLDHPVWAAMSSIIISQDTLRDTENAALWRVCGTLVGIAVAVSSGTLLETVHASVAVEIGVSVAVCAALARKWPDLRVAMWTAPIVYLTRSSDVSLWHAGLWRGTEVLLGGLIGTALHCMMERLILRKRLAADQGDNLSAGR